MGMLERNANRGELAKAQLTLQEAEEKLERIQTLLSERKIERRDLEGHIQDTAATGDMDRLVDLQNRAVMVDKTIAELQAGEVECTQRVESARRYLYTLYVRLEKLRQEFSGLMRSLASIDQGESVPSDVQTSLGRIKIQLKAITGENSTGRL
jgi:predicted  nucleic acid-binding Zn-ribbon protein